MEKLKASEIKAKFGLGCSNQPRAIGCLFDKDEISGMSMEEVYGYVKE